MADALRQEVLAAATIIVVKVGTRVVTQAGGVLNEARIAQLAEELNAICETGRRVVLVSSGAVGAGMSQLGLSRRPTDLGKLQAVAAVGQTKLIEAYDRTFQQHGRHARKSCSPLKIWTIELVISMSEIRFCNFSNTAQYRSSTKTIPYRSMN